MGLSTKNTSKVVLADRYVVAGKLGSGAFADVYRAYDERHGRCVALKVLSARRHAEADAERELLTELAKRDPDETHNVTRMLDAFGDDAGRSFLVFRLHTCSLRDHIATLTRTRARPSRREVALFVRDMGAALSFLHTTCRVVHTDIKPENVLMNSPTGGGETSFHLCDLGSASFFDGEGDDDTISTLPYRAPEVLLARKWSHAVDVWSFGCTLFEYANLKCLYPAADEACLAGMLEVALGELPSFLTGIEDGSGEGGAEVWEDDVQRSIDEAEGFSGLVRRCLRYDPVARITAEELAVHPVVVKAGLVAKEEAAARRKASFPHSAYTSYEICTPGTSFLQACSSQASCTAESESD
eukprot:Rhum_TRINITY_DN13739_c1_g1::Rhum_TRINITY_DN13739_c1_g1_i1::g.63139::m.63139